MVVELIRGPTAVRIYCNQDRRLSDNPEISIHPWLKNNLIEYEYDPREKRSFIKYNYYRYERETGILHLPVNLINQLIDYLKDNGAEYKITLLDANPSLTFDIDITADFEKREYQEKAAEFLISDGHMKALSLQTGCLSGDTIINVNRCRKGYKTSLKKFYRNFKKFSISSSKTLIKNDTHVRSFNGNRIQLHKIDDVVYSGVKPVYLIKLENGKFIKCTLDHKIMTTIGWVEAKSIKNRYVMCDQLHGCKDSGRINKPKPIDIYLTVSKNHPFCQQVTHKSKIRYRVVIHRLIYEASNLNNMTLNEFLEALKDPNKIKDLKFVDRFKFSIHHLDHDHYNNDPENLVCLSNEDHLNLHAKEGDAYSHFNQGIPSYSRAISIDYIGDEDTYDIICKDPHRNFVANGIVVHNSGKSLIAIKSLVALRQRGLIILPAFLVDQWTEVFSNATTAKIGVIQGSKSIFNLINNDYQSDANIFLASINTMYEYAIRNSQYESAPSFQEFIRKLGIGVKIVDECHLNFHANTMIDIQSDVRHNIYLSATHMRSAKNSEKIFQRIYPEEIRYKNSNHDNYINITEVRFSIGNIPEFFYKTIRGYSHFKYEKYLLKKIGRLNYLVEKVFEPLVEEYFITIRKPNQKLLILVALTEFGNLISEWLKARYPDLKVSTYFNETPDEILETSDIIVSTIGSCGTGKDIKGLRTVILTTSFSAETLTLQTVGRLRKMEDTPEFVYLVNTAIGQQIRHAKIRSEIYSGIAKKFRSVVF